MTDSPGHFTGIFTGLQPVFVQCPAEPVILLVYSQVSDLFPSGDLPDLDELTIIFEHQVHSPEQDQIETYLEVFNIQGFVKNEKARKCPMLVKR